MQIVIIALNHWVLEGFEMQYYIMITALCYKLLVCLPYVLENVLSVQISTSIPPASHASKKFFSSLSLSISFSKHLKVASSTLYVQLVTQTISRHKINP
jgi:hypothetical protein